MDANLCHFCQHYPTKFCFFELFNRSVVDFSNVKSSGLCTHDLKGHENKLSPGFNSVMIDIRRILIVIMAVMGHFSSDEAGFICFPEGRFKNVGKVI